MRKMKVSYFLKKLFFISFICLLTSCGQTYKTPIRNDPFFVNQPYDNQILRQTGAPYVQRESEISNKGNFSLKANESYDNFKKRLYNTLVMQEKNKQSLANTIIQQEEQLQKNQQQLSEIQKESLDLRLTIARLKSGGSEVTDSFSKLFSIYTIKNGDTLQKIAFQKYGDYDAWLTVYRFNLDVLKKGPNKILPGTTLLLPNLDQFSR